MKKSFDFQRNLNRVAKVQEQYLKNILNRNQACAYGREFGFRSISGYKEFCNKVPVVDYEKILPSIQATARGENSLSTDPAILLEPTSGTRSGTKYIPYNRSLKKEFQAAIAVWMNNLFRYYPEIKSTRSYWSISPPALHQINWDSKIPVGFDQDSGYLGLWGKVVERNLFCVPPEVGGIKPGDAFFSETVKHLLYHYDLGLISVWNPGFLLLLLQNLMENKSRILSRIFNGDGCLPLPPNPSRARALEKMLISDDPNLVSWNLIWPKLKIISCWADAWAKQPFQKLLQMFPGSVMQPKGLLSTEAFVTIPYQVSSAQTFHLLAFQSHFFEFKDLETGKIHPSWKLKAGQTCSVIVTTGGGLYRYNTNDLVKVKEYLGNCPSFEFLGREKDQCDLTGEKLHSEFAKKCVEQSIDHLKIKADFYFMAPLDSGNGYVLYLQSQNNFHEIELAEQVEVRLQESFHYGLSRKLGQLQKLRVTRIHKDAAKQYYNYKSQKTKFGDVKFCFLEKPGQWESVFNG